MTNRIKGFLGPEKKPSKLRVSHNQMLRVLKIMVANRLIANKDIRLVAIGAIKQAEEA